MHHHTKLGYKRSSGSEDIRKIHTPIRQFQLPPPPPKKQIIGGGGGRRRSWNRNNLVGLEITDLRIGGDSGTLGEDGASL